MIHVDTFVGMFRLAVSAPGSDQSLLCGREACWGRLMGLSKAVAEQTHVNLLLAFVESKWDDVE